LIAVDTNLLVYAHRADSPFHQIAFRRLAELAEGLANWAIPWPCLHEFIGVVTNTRIYAPPSTLEEAFDQVEAWLASPSLVLIAESTTHWPTLRTVLATSRCTGPQVHDARVAAICRQHGVREIWSADRDFTRFEDVSVVNPLLRQ
jgi:toxin-antitoxin system PIN domain toxin